MKIASGLLIVLCMISTALGGTVDPGLLTKIANADPQAKITALIFMSGQLDVAAMTHHHNQIQATRAERHYDVVTALQRMATESQADLLNYLTQSQAAGNVGQFRGYWIANMVIADLTPAEIYRVAERGDVAAVYSDFMGELIKPIIDENYDPGVIASVERGVKAVRADSMWAHGYTGEGRLVMNIDTGVDGSHPALNHSWRGNNGHPASESWLDTANPSNNFPHDEGQHGTHTMGTICGRSTTTADTVGVAIDAQWIAARAVDVTGGNIAAAFEWGADPDGDPNTVEDVPDVISNSWGSLPAPGNECPPSFYSLIDNCEAAGAVVVFAAGNEGPGAGTLRIPSNRITSPYNCFSVGAIDGNNNNFPIASFSSRGPSQCDSATIKPEVVAPGYNVRSSVPGGRYESGWSGTSMACPHVAGAVALLRQVNPNASVDTIKWALMASARDLPFSNPNGEDNTYGWGIIDINAARLLIPPITSPFIFPSGAYVVEPNDNYPDPGETISLHVRLKNSGLLATNVATILSTTNPFAAITQDSCYFGSIAENDTARSAAPFVISFSNSAPSGTRINFLLNITADSGYNTTKWLSLMVGHLAELAIATHDTGNVAFTISNFGRYGVPPDGLDGQWQGRGFRMPRTGSNHLFEGALLIGNGPTRISNTARDDNQSIGADFLPLTSIATLEPGPWAPQEYHSVFNDQAADNPLDIQVTQKSYAWPAAPDNDYVIMEYTIANIGVTQLDSVLLAHYTDWDIPWGSPADRANFDRERKMGYQYSGTSNYRGMAVLSDLGAYSFKALDNANEVYPPHFTTEEKWTYMNAGTTDTSWLSGGDASIMITTGPYTIAAGDSVVAAIAMIGGTNLADLRANADAAIIKYTSMTSVNDDDAPIPQGFSLAQNYPNPFNAMTTIRFDLATPGPVRLETFDLLGRKVATLVDGRLDAGSHTIIWDCGNLTSGIYFYKLSVGDNSAVKKLMLLK